MLLLLRTTTTVMAILLVLFCTCSSSFTALAFVAPSVSVSSFRRTGTASSLVTPLSSSSSSSSSSSVCLPFSGQLQQRRLPYGVAAGGAPRCCRPSLLQISSTRLHQQQQQSDDDDDDDRETTTTTTTTSITTTAIPEDDDDDDSDFVEYLNRKELRQMVQTKSPIFFQDWSPIEREYVVQAFQQFIVQPKEIIFQQGDDGDGLYLVQNGTIEIVDQLTQQVLTTYQAGDVFGELSLLFNEPRAATARVQDNADGSGAGAVVWKLAKNDFLALQKANDKVQERAVQTVSQDPKYVQYLERKQLKDALQLCPIFKGVILSEDLDRIVERMTTVTYAKGDIIVQQGNVGDAMYFVKSGTVVVSVEPNNKVVAEIGPNGYFGELALLFNQPRAATVRALDEKGVVVWKLSATQFLEAVQEYPLAEKTLELLQQKYQEDSLWSTLQKASLEEIFDLIRNSSRPKKKNVTLHSTVSGLYVGMFLLAYLPQFHPMLYNRIGAPQIFNALDLSDETILQYRLCSFAVCIVSLMGEFRIPKNAPDCRKYYFTTMLLASMAMWSYGDSNVGGAVDAFTFDIFTPLGAGVITVTNVIAAIWVLLAADNAIAGPLQGRETLPMLTNRYVAAAFYSFLYLLFYVQMNNLVWENYDYAGYEQIALPFYQMGFERFGLVAGVAVNGALAFGAFFGTLLFEKKISKVTATILNFVLMFGTLLDQFLSFQMDKNLPQYAAVVPVSEWMAHYREEFHTNEIMLGIWGLVIANALRKRITEDMSGGGEARTRVRGSGGGGGGGDGAVTPRGAAVE